MKTLWDILPSVARGTEQGKIKWEPQASGQSFGASLDTKYRLAVMSRTDEDTQIHEFRLQLSDADQMLYDEIRANEFDQHYPSLDRLFHAARRSATNADDVIGEVEKVLSRLQV